MARHDLAKDIGRRLTEGRQERRLSQTGLARVLGVSRGAVGQWETGQTAPSTENLAAAAIELRVSFDWLATGRPPKMSAAPEAGTAGRGLRHIPVVSWISAGRLADASSQIPVEDVPLLAFADLGRGEFFALKVQGDSMDRWSPEGSTIVINRADRDLVAGRGYVFSVRGETTYKIWHPDPPYLAPYSTNPAHQPIFIKRRRELEVIGRVRRTVLDL
jgi:SOS-response transcriptional repressor LexA